MSLQYFSPGKVQEANLEILKVICRGRLRKDTRYWVRYLCCGREEERTHYQIKERARRFRTVCRKCSKSKSEKSLGSSSEWVQVGVVPPSWPVPNVDD